MTREEHNQKLERRIQRGAHMISVLEGRRRASGDPNLGSNIERMIIGRELEDLEHEIGLDPGALAPYICAPAPRDGQTSLEE